MGALSTIAISTQLKFTADACFFLRLPLEFQRLRLDADLLRWFRQQRGYQTRIKAILRAYIQAQR